MRGSGESDARFGRLLAEQFQQHSRLFYKLAYGIVRDSTAAEDVCQQALTRAWEHRGRLVDPGKLRPWLARTVVNEALQIVRRRGTEARVLGRIGVREEAKWPEEHRLELRETILGALSNVPEPTRTILSLRLIRQHSGNEVARLLGCSPAEVSRHLHAGMAQLRLGLEFSEAGGARS